MLPKCSQCGKNVLYSISAIAACTQARCRGHDILMHPGNFLLDVRCAKY
jgi:DNA-directed RNA polymerase subunit RPC12/RpoP